MCSVLCLFYDSALKTQRFSEGEKASFIPMTELNSKMYSAENMYMSVLWKIMFQRQSYILGINLRNRVDM